MPSTTRLFHAALSGVALVLACAPRTSPAPPPGPPSTTHDAVGGDPSGADPASGQAAAGTGADASTRCGGDGDCVIGSLECGPCGSCWGPGSAYNRAWLEAEQARCSAERERMKEHWDEHPVNCEPCPSPEEDSAPWPKHARCAQGSCVPIVPSGG